MIKQKKGKKGANIRGVYEPTRTGLGPKALTRAILDNLYYIQGRDAKTATPNDWYMALAYTVRDRLLQRWIKTVRTLFKECKRVTSYLSAEFLLGPHLANNLVNLGIYDEIKHATSLLGVDLEDILEQEEEPGLGNGGLGRLAACFLDSLATLELPAIGYGIRYEFGIFDQTIHNGYQIELTDKWLRFGNPWEIYRPEVSYNIKWGGRTEMYHDERGRLRVKWIPDREVKGVAYDTPILGYQVNNTNLLRLWKAEAVESFDFQSFNVGDYFKAVNQKIVSETVTKVLYPNDKTSYGKELRLAQQYFFTSCSLQDMLRIHKLAGGDINEFHKSWAIQLNDTHPAISVAELMRLLIDEHQFEWDHAWEVTKNTFAYTNHTLLPEALETWPLPLFQRVLPRHLEIIYEINHRFLDGLRLKHKKDHEKIARLSLIDESHHKSIRMANLASVGSFAINGVSALHSDLLKKTVLKDFYDINPEKFHNITNGVTPRRWLVVCNPRLANLISEKIGDHWIRHMESDIKKIEAFADDPDFQRKWHQVKYQNKCDLASLIKERVGMNVDPNSLFDIQVKRIHEYKRQHLNLLHIITLYNRIKKDPKIAITPRTFVFGGKAAPGYVNAKLIIKLINSVGEVVNKDPDVSGRLKVVFFPNFNVKNGQHIYPAADLCEQISTAGKEASGTGNMKFVMNGALNIATYDGANVEIAKEVGDENYFLFGLKIEEIDAMRANHYRPHKYYAGNSELKEVIDLILSGHFSHGDRSLFKPLVDSLLHHDEYMLLADYQTYIDTQAKIGQIYADQKQWTKMSVLNVARAGTFSSDRSIREYTEKIWKIKPVKIKL